MASRKFPLLVAVLALGGAAWFLRSESPSSAAEIQAGARADAAQETFGPRPEPADAFHPLRDTKVEPAYGGTLRLHIESLPNTLNHALANLTTAITILGEIHANLVAHDWESWKIAPELATSWEVADTLVAKDGRVYYGLVWDLDGRVLVGALTVPPAVPVKPHDALAVSLDPANVERVERGTVVTFHLRDDAKWHDGRSFTADDVLFSWQIAANPEVRCDWVRPYLKKIVRAEKLDAHTVRFYFAEQYFNTLGLFADDFCILPRHLYDLTDPSHPRYKKDASPAECAKEINDNPCNTQWVGLGPYKLTSYSQQGVEAERFADFFDPEHSGYADKIVWRFIANDDAAFQALLNGELDFTLRISSDQYFGEATQQKAFTDRLYKGYFYLGAFNYIPWNMRRPILADLHVRQALAHAMDLESYVQTVAHGLAVLPTGPQCYFGPSYNREVQRLAFDLERARALFSAAGWYDRDGDGVLDKDGKPFAIEMLIINGNKSAEIFGRMYQESLAKIGVQLKLTPVDQATYFRRLINERDFDAGMSGLSVDGTENDPTQMWHSSSAVNGGSNHAGVIDPKVDALIARGDRELDDQKRWAIWRELHRYLYEEVQPFFYREAPPRKFALNKEIRGAQFFRITPGFSARRWFFPAGTPGTRARREAEKK